MRIAEGVKMLAIKAAIMGKPAIIHPVLLWDSADVILVDAGYPGQLQLIREAMGDAGVPFGRLNKVIITHHDVDHMGSLKNIIAASPARPAVIAHEAEKPYIQGDLPPLKMAQLEARLDSLPREMKEVYEKLAAFYQHGTVPVSTTVTDGEELPYCGGIEVIHTPGHTRGHICLYVRRCKALIAGDAMKAEGGRLVRMPDTAVYDAELSMKSLRKLAKYDVRFVICYHGGLCRENVNRQIAELANESGVLEAARHK